MLCRLSVSPSDDSSACLSFSYNISRSTYVWEAAPEQLYGTPEKAINALEATLHGILKVWLVMYIFAPLYLVGRKVAIEYHQS